MESIQQLFDYNQCYKEYNSDLKLGGLDANPQLITYNPNKLFIVEIK